MTFLDKVISSFSKTARTQEMKGIEKYGHELQPLEQKYDWLEMAKEEIVDGFKYLEAERERRDFITKKIEYKLVQLTQCDSYNLRCSFVKDILAELDNLQGK